MEKIVNHPDYCEEAWSVPGVKEAALSLDPGLRVEVLVERLMKILNEWGYDSIDREMAFKWYSDQSGIDYNDYYDAWLNGAGVW